MVARCAAMERRPGGITPRLARPGSPRRTRWESGRRRHAREERQRPKMARVSIRALAAELVSRQRITRAVIEGVWQNEKARDIHELFVPHRKETVRCPE